MIESNDDKINSSGLVSGLSRADYRRVVRAAGTLTARIDDPLDANYWRIRRATEPGS
jgi:hypothetical protein